MAKFTMDGLDALVLDMQKHEEQAREKATKMLAAAGEVLRAAQEREALSTFTSDRSTGELARSIKVSKMHTQSGTKFVDIAPTGTDKNGIRNAEKGFILEHGRSNMPARPWMARANEKSADRALEVMREVWDAEESE